MPGQTITRMADLCRREVGTIEGPRSNETRYGAEYGFNFVPWCAIFLSIMSRDAGAMYLGKPWRFASTISSRDHARKNGRWSTDIRVGTIVMKAYTGSTGHVGLCLGKQKDGGVVTIEGNTSAGSAGSQRDGGSVRLRVRYGFWDGCIVLDETDASTTPTGGGGGGGGEGNKCADSGGHPLLKLGSKGGAVNHLQYFLIKSGSKIVGDGDFGSGTRQALINHQQWLRDNKDNTITVDGECGNQTWQAMHNWADGLKI